MKDPRGPIMRARTNGVLLPLRELPDREVKLAADWIDYARKTGLSVEERHKALTTATKTQDEIIERMEKILTYLQKMEGYQEAVRLLNEIMGEEEELYKKTKTELEKMFE